MKVGLWWVMDVSKAMTRKQKGSRGRTDSHEEEAEIDKRTLLRQYRYQLAHVRDDSRRHRHPSLRVPYPIER
jgi:hypothetical protein